MSEDENKNEAAAEKITTALVEAADTSSLNKEALTIINQLITEADADKQKDLTYLFNQNQNKKTMVRVDKMSNLLDVITSQALNRITSHPEELSNLEMFNAMKTVAELIEKGQKQIIGAEQDAPFIQINQQNNELNMGDSNKLNRESRERVKNAVLSLLNEVSTNNAATDETSKIIDKTLNGDKND